MSRRKPDPTPGSRVRHYQRNGTSFDDALALVTSALGPIDENVLLEQIKPVLDDGARAVAVIEMLAVFAAGFIEQLAEAAGTTPESLLQRLALADRDQRSA